jgi:hypothetical protein
MMDSTKPGLSRRSMIALLLAMLLALAQFVFIPKQAHGEAASKLTVYDESLSSEFVDYSWADMDPAESKTVHNGSRSIRLNPDHDQALYFYKDRIMNADDYESLQFWIHGGAAGGQSFKLVLSLGGQAVAEIKSAQLLPEGIAAGEWKQVNVKLADYGIRGLLDGIWIWGEGDQESLYLDDMVFQPKDGGSEPPPNGDAQIINILFEQPQLTLREGQNRAVGIKAIMSSGAIRAINEGVTWSTADAAIARVSGGMLQAVGEGNVIISAAYEGFQAQMQVVVTARSGNPAEPIEAIEGLYMYDDELTSKVVNYSWAQHSLEEEEVVHTGVNAIRFEPRGDDALYFYNDRFISAKDYDKLQLWIHGGEAGGQAIKLAWMSGGQSVVEKQLSELLPEGLPAGEWTKVVISLTDLNLPGQIFDGLLIAGTSGGEQSAVYLDDLALLAKPVAQVPIAEVRMDKPQVVMLEAEEQELQAEAFFETGLTQIVTDKAVWASDHPEIVSVEQGTIKALSPGIAKITAAYKTFTAESYVQVTEIAPQVIYEDGLAEGFRNQSWHDKDLANREQAHSGSQSIKFEPDGWDGVWLVGSEKKRISDYYGFQFWIHGGSLGGQELLFHAYDGDTSLGAIHLNEYLPAEGLAPDVWTPITVNFADLGLHEGQFDGLIFQAATESNQGTVYIDDVHVLRNLHAGELPEPQLPTVNVTIDAESNRKPINPDIYGINFDDTHPTKSTLSFPVQRWGGNNTTRYNWELDVANRASDWYFMNYPYENENPGQLPHGSMSDRFIDQTHASGGQVLLTVPTIGWTPNERKISYGFSRQKYGQQQSVAQELPDAGNGVFPDGSLVTNNDPADTSKRIGTDFVTRWMEHIAGRTGDKVNFYALDNEPEIWHVTHRDVHPNPPTYDEIWGFTKEYGAAIKEKDPDAKVFGPTSWGWCAYFYSSADNCADGPDRQNHEGTPFLEWYLQQVGNYEEQTNVRLVDYLDIHYYSQENGVPTGDEGPATAIRRFQALKALYDPNFIDDSWIQEPIRLIPRMKEMIEQNLPGTKLAITEYNFGNGNGITAGLAQAEVLAIFGREGVDLATRFGTLPAGTPLEDAFKLYLNYDGEGSKIEGTSVKTVSSLHDAVGSYTVQGEDGKLYVLLFNKDTVTRAVNVATNDAQASLAKLYRFDAKTSLTSIGQVESSTEGQLALRLPARSATLVVIPAE